MVPYWKQIMTNNVDLSPGMESSQPTIHELWAPISEMEIRRGLPAGTTSAGPDGIAARLIRKIPSEILVRIYNIIMWCGKAPRRLLESITTLIAKKSGASSPGDFRPITVSSVFIRTLHKVLSSRMAKLVHLDPRQRAFRPTDGCSDNIFLLDLLLRYHHKHHKPLFMASLDIAKAFDSVSHKTIEETLQVMGVPEPMVMYIKDVYAGSSTQLCCNGWTSAKIHPDCGVKQGDPMSPMIFNMVIDRLLKRLPSEIGVKVSGLTINAAAFADDMLLFASTPVGLQRMLNMSIQFLGDCGLKINATKCMTVALRNVPHEKKTVVDKETIFLCEKRILPALKRSDDWKYLGVPFTPEGRTQSDVARKLSSSLERLTKAPLKPQQRLFALSTMVIPGLFHQLELGCTTLSTLRKVDTILRQAVRRWLSMPTDTPNAYIHANVKDGGLGITSLRWSVPLRRLRRLEKLPIAEQGTIGAPGSFLQKDVAQCKQRLKDGNRLLETSSDINRRWAELLHASVDGVGLKNSDKVPQQHSWLKDGTSFLTGNDYLQACKLRINALPTKSRTARGQFKERFCRAGCNKAETLNHVLQQCHRTHGPRIKRHDALVIYAVRALEAKNYEVHVEPKLTTQLGVRKPDIIATKENFAIVIDAQVINDQYSPEEAHRNKIRYYQNIEEDIKNWSNKRNIIFTSITLSWRGIWSKQSAESLLQLRVIKKKDLKVLATRAIVGGLCAFYQFNKTTAVKEMTSKRTGVKNSGRKD